ncbi:lipolytic protein-like protein G-D-S-L family [Byssothecium circinans]|uniref:Lipolytic protein-like protein G-D-S-L family n=1 Tax=Byssothecium circinans TaxID=147558 RepID=A0A6A5TAY1_9PLEO|nr:lipolytic protein-like protein G-D-S-L family [Byssothecium circinans]
MKASTLLASLAIAFNAANAVRILGRVNPATRELTWPGTGVSFSFNGCSARIGLGLITGTNSAELTVDGIATVIPNVNGTYISTPTNLTEGTHTVILRKRSEAVFGSFVLGNVTTDGSFLPDVQPTRKIEVIGDSITVGYGIDGVNPCVNTAALENNPKTYAVLAAEALKADYTIIAWSGLGLTRNYMTQAPSLRPIIPVLWTRYGANDVNNTYTFPNASIPDVVIINVGTNDFSYLGVREPLNATDFTNAMISFVQTIWTRYPDAEYFLLTSPMLSDDYPAGQVQKTTQTQALTKAIEELNSTRVHLVDWPTQGSDTACDYHPNAATNAAQAPVLAEAIAKELGW